MPLNQTSGNATADSFGGGVAAVPNYIEDVFSTYLYTGNGSTQTITNNIDLSTKGGLVWTKVRSTTGGNWFCDTARGNTSYIYSNGTSAQLTYTTQITSFNTTGFSLGSEANANESSQTFSSWTFRKQPKFFDVVTYTGDSTARTIAHSLGSVPGCIIVKRTDTTANWGVYHRSLANTEYLQLNTTAAKLTSSVIWNSTTATDTVFSLGDSSTSNQAGGTYVAYLFAHDAGGFGLTGTDNVISCGSYTGNNSGSNIQTLGYEPQWLLVKNTTTGGTNWYEFDNMRGMGVNGPSWPYLSPNTSSAETTNDIIGIDATGFNPQGALNSNSANYIYIAIRRGPMKVPTDATKVFAPVALTGEGSNPTTITAGFTPDLYLSKSRNQGSIPFFVTDRLRGGTLVLSTSNVIYNAEGTDASWVQFDKQTTIAVEDSWLMGAGGTYINYFFRRAPGFFDEVCYTGTGSNTTKSHNLGSAPELMLIKKRSGASNWVVYAATLGAVPVLSLNNNSSKSNEATYLNSTAPTASVFSIGTAGETNDSGATYVAYLFATCAGVSKVGSYTGNGSSQTINCGFTGGARFVMIKRTNNTGDWYVWDTARGMVAGTDPFLRLNETYTENNTNSVYTVTTGFQVTTTEAEMNASGSNYIFLAIA